MHPLKQLRQLLAKDATPGQGKVIKVGSELRIATYQGSLSFTPNVNDATVYRVGDTVLLANGVVVGRRNREPTVYVI